MFRLGRVRLKLEWTMLIWRSSINVPSLPGTLVRNEKQINKETNKDKLTRYVIRSVMCYP